MKNKDYYHDADMIYLCEWALKKKEIKTEKEFPAWLEAEYRQPPHLTEEEYMLLAAFTKIYPTLREEGFLIKEEYDTFIFGPSLGIRVPLKDYFKLKGFYCAKRYKISDLLKDTEEYYGYKYEYHGK